MRRITVDFYRKGLKGFCFSLFLLFSACAIENDIPYPLIEGMISEIEVEGLRASEDGAIASGVDINRTERTVTLYVNDSVDVSRLKINRLILEPRDATLEVDTACCVDAEKFPSHDFASLDSLPVSANTRLDCSMPLKLNVKTYYDHIWKLSVRQIVEREVEVDGMTRYVLDPDNRTLVIYMNEDCDLSDVHIRTMNLGGAYGTVAPDPSTVRDYSFSQTFQVKRSGEEEPLDWKVIAVPDENAVSVSNVFPMVAKAVLTGSVTGGKKPVFEFQEKGANAWTVTEEIAISGTSFTATLSGLRSQKTYNYRVNVEEQTVAQGSFTTGVEIPLPNGGLEEWSDNGKNPWLAGSEPFWGTGNKASSILSSVDKITYPVDESVSGKAALLESKNAMIKLAAGNLFAGDFELDGMDGLLTFGRPFTSFPTALRFHYKFTTSTISIVGTNMQDKIPAELKTMVGQPDSCHVYIALSDKNEPYSIRNKPSNRQLFDKNDKNIIAYGEFISGTSTSNYQQITIPLEYRALNRTPKYIVIVCTSSKYGDYYLGGVGSKLWLDEMELVYE